MVFRFDKTTPQFCPSTALEIVVWLAPHAVVQPIRAADSLPACRESPKPLYEERQDADTYETNGLLDARSDTC